VPVWAGGFFWAWRVVATSRTSLVARRCVEVESVVARTLLVMCASVGARKRASVLVDMPLVAERNAVPSSSSAGLLRAYGPGPDIHY